MRTASRSSQIAQSRPRALFVLLSRVLILVLALLLVACAGVNAASHSAPKPTSPFISTSGNQLVTVVEQSPVPGAVTVHITELEFSIHSSITKFYPNVHYYFIVSNQGKQTHAFTFVPTYPDGKSMNEGKNEEEIIALLIKQANPELERVSRTFHDVVRYDIATNYPMTVQGYTRYWRKKHPEKLVRL